MKCNACEREKFRKENPDAMMMLNAISHTCKPVNIKEYRLEKIEKSIDHIFLLLKVLNDKIEDVKCDS